MDNTLENIREKVHQQKYILFKKNIFQYNVTENITILEWFAKNIDSNIDSNIDLKNNIILINNHHIVHPNVVLYDIFEKLQTNKIRIEIIPRLKGGGLIDMFMSIIKIGEVFLTLGDLIIWFGKFIAWFIFFIGWLFKFLFYDLITDFYNSLLVIIVTIFTLPFNLLSGIFAFGMNSIGGWFTTIWGWDQSNLTYNDKNSNYFKGIDRVKGKKCYLTSNNTVPFSIILGTIICPPLGVFMDLGATGWFNILICTLLTLMFYVPGLVYALLVIYS